MNIAAMRESIDEEIRGRDLFKKYNTVSSIDILEVIDLKERLEQFSWGILYLYIHSFKNDQIGKQDIAIAANVEMLCLSSKILDDFLDEDTSISEIISKQNIVLLFTNFLIESLKHLCYHPSYEHGLVYLQEAIYGEWLDVNKTVLDGITEQEYLDNIIQKTVSIFKFVAVFANPEERSLWDDFSIYAGTAMQLSNDINAIFNDGKSDLLKLKPTLPLLKSLNVLNEDKKAEMERMFSSILKGDTCLDPIREAITASGSLDYCLLLRELYKEKCTELLNEHFPEKELLVQELLEYLELVN
ncbi:MAG TPA: class 1 isoprenoid biosynthesis enzyme [Paenibacillus sp.]|jgi:geranylgeranyl pyrophosphate synthase